MVFRQFLHVCHVIKLALTQFRLFCPFRNLQNLDPFILLGISIRQLNFANGYFHTGLILEFHQPKLQLYEIQRYFLDFPFLIVLSDSYYQPFNAQIVHKTFHLLFLSQSNQVLNFLLDDHEVVLVKLYFILLGRKETEPALLVFLF